MHPPALLLANLLLALAMLPALIGGLGLRYIPPMLLIGMADRDEAG